MNKGRPSYTKRPSQSPAEFPLGRSKGNANEEHHLYCHILENIADFVDELRDEKNAPHMEILDLISGRIHDVLRIPESEPTEIALVRFLHGLIDNLLPKIGRDGLQIKTRFQEGLAIQSLTPLRFL